jgi:serine/threonine protein kinase
MIGRTISHYRIVEKLGEGGMGVVYVAEDTLLGRRVAIKTLTAARGLGEQHFRSRFLREARAISKLSQYIRPTLHRLIRTLDLKGQGALCSLLFALCSLLFAMA